MKPILVDCRHYVGSAPCAFHKRDGRPCVNCRDYDPIRARLLIVKLAAIGDVLRTTSLLPALKRAHPDAHVTWITDRESMPVLAGHPQIDRLLPSDCCVPSLLVERFDVVYGLDADARSGTLAALAHGERRVGYVTDENGRVVPAGESAVAWWLMGLDDRLKVGNRKTYQQLMYELCGLAGEIARPYFTVPEASRRRAEQFRKTGALASYPSVLGLNTGGGGRWAQKKWTPEGYAAFIALVRERHPETAVVLLGGPSERELNARLLSSRIDGLIDGGATNSFADFAAIVGELDALVTSDSLGLHTALAVATPVVVLIGPTSPWELELYGDGVTVHAPDLPCIGCYRAACDKPITCMERLEPALVLEAVEPLLAPQNGGAGSQLLIRQEAGLKPCATSATP